MIIKPLIDITLSLILLEFSEQSDDEEEDEDEDDDVVSTMIGFFALSFEVETGGRARRQSAGEGCKLIINNTVMISMEFLNIDDLLFSIFWDIVEVV